MEKPEMPRWLTVELRTDIAEETVNSPMPTENWGIVAQAIKSAVQGIRRGYEQACKEYAAKEDADQNQPHVNIANLRQELANLTGKAVAIGCDGDGKWTIFLGREQFACGTYAELISGLNRLCSDARPRDKTLPTISIPLSLATAFVNTHSTKNIVALSEFITWHLGKQNEQTVANSCRTNERT